HCPPHLSTGVVDGNVLVAAPCERNGTTVKGNVHVYAGGSLIARGAHIDGNIQAENAFEIDVENSEIGGSIQLDDLVGDSGRVADSRIDGSIQLEDNRSVFQIHVIGSDIQAFDNVAAIDIVGNVVDGFVVGTAADRARVRGQVRPSARRPLPSCSRLPPLAA